MNCAECIKIEMKCCGEFFADGQCCGAGEPVTVKCPQHAIEKVPHLVPQTRRAEAA